MATVIGVVMLTFSGGMALKRCERFVAMREKIVTVHDCEIAE